MSNKKSKGSNRPQRILITGASRGIGRSIALRLAGKDIALVLQGRDGTALHEVARACEALGSTVSTHVLSFDDLGEVERFAQTISAVPVDVLVNNAGLAVVAPVAEQPIADWQRTMTVNLFAPVVLTRALLPQLRDGSSIVNIASVASFTGFPNWGSYCASKFALEGFSQSLRAEVQSRGIRVISIHPASTATDIFARAGLNNDLTKMMSPDDIAEGVACALAMPASTLVRTMVIANTRPV